MLTVGITCTVISAAEVLGFGVTAADMARFTASTSLLGDLATTYLGSGIGDVFDIFAMLSALGAALASTAAASRIMFALLRDVAPTNPLGRIETDSGTPRNAAVLIVVSGVLGYALMRHALGASASDAFFWGSTLAALGILLVYLLVTIGAAASVVRATSGGGRATLMIPILAAAAITYTLWVNVFPLKSGAYAVLPWVVVGWIAIPAIAMIALPNITRDISAGLAQNADQQHPG